VTIGDEDAIDLLTQVVSTPSLCGDEDAVAAVLLQSSREMGFDACRDAAGNVVATIGPRNAERSVVILGHMDTVPGVIPVEKRDGALFGRGTVDAKGPLVTGLVAAARAAQGARSKVTVIGAVQEEGPSAGARYLARQPAPDFLVIAEPGGWNAIVLGYKGSVRFTVGVSQPLTHTAGKEPTAPERLIVFWNDLDAWCRRRSPESEGHGAKGGFNHLTATLIGMSSETNGLTDRAAMNIGLRLPPGITVDSARDGVQELFPDAEFAFQIGEEAVRAEKSTPLVAGFLRAIREQGGNPHFKVKTGTSDMNVVGPAWGCPMLAYGPGDSSLDHTPDEHIEIEEYLLAIRVLTTVLEDL
jgi:LysW-gamma-L-lysine carboxypeptidase